MIISKSKAKKMFRKELHWIKLDRCENDWKNKAVDSFIDLIYSGFEELDCEEREDNAWEMYQKDETMTDAELHSASGKIIAYNQAMRANKDFITKLMS